jgi:hypothetical protein
MLNPKIKTLCENGREKSFLQDSDLWTGDENTSLSMV